MDGPTSNQRTKAMHYVPRGYLKLFCEESALWVFEKESGKKFRTGPMALAQESSFYTIRGEDGTEATQFNEQELGEKAMQAFEEDFYGARDLVLSEGRFVGIRDDVRMRLAHGIAVQYLRTRSARDNMAATIESVMTATAEEFAVRNFGPELRGQIRGSLDEEFHGTWHMGMILDPEYRHGIASLLLEHAWILARTTDGQFHTSDDPVVRWPHARRGFLSNLGFGSPGIEIIFPLSPTYAVVIREPSFHSDWAAQDGRCIEYGPEEVNRCNVLQAASAYRFIFSRVSDFAAAERFFLKNPHMRGKSLYAAATKFGSPKPRGNGELSQLIHFKLDQPNIDLT